MRAEIKVSGIIQGVGFRPFIYRTAVANRLLGYVRNRGDAGVEIVVEGNKNNIEVFLRELKEKKPPLARIHGTIVNFMKDTSEFEKFTILESSNLVELSGSVISPDSSICSECLDELRTPRDKRYEYFFITCTNCGPRYTTIRRLPYDRVNTTMDNFPMCGFCLKEYKDPSNRRFHAQTIACKKCGPRVYLTTNDGKPVKSENPIREAGKLIEEGNIIAIKGNGGFHVATATTLTKVIDRLRKVKYRARKPLAIMARDIGTTMSFAEVSPEETKLLASYIKPIVLLKKRDDFFLSEAISPGLNSIGVMLPYTGLHYLLFDDISEPAFVMTSANPPNRPIVIDNHEAIKRLGTTVDFFLFHDRLIAQRCDDSVVRLHGKNHSIIRRSRGYSPAPIHIDMEMNNCTLGVGAELNVTVCLQVGNKAFLSQHIGDVENLETLNFQKNTINHLKKLTNTTIEVIACDLHPKFITTLLAKNLGSKLDCTVKRIQHHHAHIAALMGEHNIGEIIGIACDGFGYGTDGNAWGGEILYCDQKGFQRLGHLQEQLMIGGDLATKYPLRMAAGILGEVEDVEKFLLENSRRFRYGEKEAQLIMRQLDRKISPKTTSCGRLLDSISAILGICYERTYEGEPAMKLESFAMKGKDVLELKPKISNNIIDTTSLLYEIFKRKSTNSVADLAYSAESYVARSLAQLSIEKAEQLGIELIGFTGGVAYNEHITSTIQRIVNRNGLRFITHKKVPPGDGGISFGQVMASNMIAQ